MTNQKDRAVLELASARKTFGQVVALANGSIEVLPGEVHALVGENGAGKSTLVKILAGVFPPDSGKFTFEGQPVELKSVADSKALGISVIYQEPTLFPDLTVAENIFIGRQPRSSLRLISRSQMNREARKLFDQLGVAIDPDRLAEGLSIADQQIIEIAKAISLDARLLVMDEPTAALSGVEVERLFSIVRGLTKKKVGVIFISHRFEEIFEISQRITVMRDGSYIGTWETGATSTPEIVGHMVGREVSELFPKVETQPGAEVLLVQNLTRFGVFRDVSFSVRKGEIVALAGLVGSGRSEVARAIFGIDRYDSGSVIFDGSSLAPGNPKLAIDQGMAFVPEDRRKQGLILELPVGRNIALTLRDALARIGLISNRDERELARDWGRQLQVKAPTLGSAAGTLSGGNQQKVVLAKWLATSPKLLIVDEPTRGIDVGTKSEVHRLISSLAAEGIGILMISSELPEVLGMADQIVVMREGKVSTIVDRAGASAEKIMMAATHIGDAA